MRAVITGGSGLIGRALGERLVVEGWEVVALSRSPRQVSGLPEGMRAAPWDPGAVGEWTEVLEGADAVVHLAGESIAGGRWTEARKRRMRRSRVGSGRVLVEAFGGLDRPPPVFVQASAVGYYGPRGDEELTESAAPGDGFLAELAVEWEGATAPLEESGVRRPVLRTGLVLARRGGALPKMLPAFKLGLGGPLGDGRQWMPWIHLVDEVAAIRHLMGRDDASGPYNLTAPAPVRNEEFAERLADALGRPAWLRTPAFVLKLALGELSDALLTGQRALPARLQQQGFDFRFPRLEEALEELVG